MGRREEIRATMHSLLSSVEWPEPQLRAENLRPVEPQLRVENLRSVEALPFAPSDVSGLALSEQQLSVIRDIQAVLRQHGIEVELWEIVQAVIGALSARPSLCRSLLGGGY